MTPVINSCDFLHTVQLRGCGAGSLNLDHRWEQAISSTSRLKQLEISDFEPSLVKSFLVGLGAVGVEKLCLVAPSIDFEILHIIAKSCPSLVELQVTLKKFSDVECSVIRSRYEPADSNLRRLRISCINVIDADFRRFATRQIHRIFPNLELIEGFPNTTFEWRHWNTVNDLYQTPGNLNTPPPSPTDSWSSLS